MTLIGNLTIIYHQLQELNCQLPIVLILRIYVSPTYAILLSLQALSMHLMLLTTFLVLHLMSGLILLTMQLSLVQLVLSKRNVLHNCDLMELPEFSTNLMLSLISFKIFLNLPVSSSYILTVSHDFCILF